MCGLCACEKKHYSRTHKNEVKWRERARAKRKYCGNEAASKYWLSKRLATQSISTLDGDSQIVARAFTIIATYLVSQALLDGTRCAGLDCKAMLCRETWPTATSLLWDIVSLLRVLFVDCVVVSKIKTICILMSLKMPIKRAQKLYLCTQSLPLKSIKSMDLFYFISQVISVIGCC